MYVTNATLPRAKLIEHAVHNLHECNVGLSMQLYFSFIISHTFTLTL